MLQNRAWSHSRPSGTLGSKCSRPKLQELNWIAAVCTSIPSWDFLQPAVVCLTRRPRMLHTHTRFSSICCRYDLGPQSQNLSFLTPWQKAILVGFVSNQRCQGSEDLTRNTHKQRLLHSAKNLWLCQQIRRCLQPKRGWWKRHTLYLQGASSMPS